MKILTIGTFDGVHYGHVRLFERAQKYGPLTVGVNSDKFVEAYKGRRSVQSEALRMRSLVHGYGITGVVLNDGSGIDLIRRERPNLLVIGSDWLDKDYTGQLGTTAEELAELQVAVLFLPRTLGVSSTELRAA